MKKLFISQSKDYNCGYHDGFIDAMKRATNYLNSGNGLLELININDAQSRYDFVQKFEKKVDKLLPDV